MLIKQNTKSTNRRVGVNILAAALVSAGLAFTAVPANAYIPSKEEVRITIKAVDLETASGVQKVYEYMVDQAEQSCTNHSRTTLEYRRFQEVCESELLASFVEDVNDDRLTAYHERQIATDS